MHLKIISWTEIKLILKDYHLLHMIIYDLQLLCIDVIFS